MSEHALALAGGHRYHVGLLVYLLEKLQKTPDGDGTLLDHSMILYGSAMGDGNQHNHYPLPIVLAGSASGRLKGGRHIRNTPETTTSNLLVAMLDKLGIPTEKFGDSTGMLSIRPDAVGFRTRGRVPHLLVPRRIPVFPQCASGGNSTARTALRRPLT